jgi:hypothetical protein
MKVVRRTGIAALAALCLLALLPIEAASRMRTVRGRVLSADGEGLKGAVVQIKNVRTLRVRSFISQEGGHSFRPAVP